jgi:RNA polymerase sigma-70 factor (ECF subfamily)
MDELKIIESCKSWNTEFFWIIYDKYIDKIYQFVYYKTYDEQIAQDITSETFFKAVKSLNKFDTKKEGTSFKSWIFKIAYNNVIDYYKKKKEDLCIDDIIETWDYNDFSKNIDDKQKLKEVLDYLKTIKKEHREILIMKIWDNMSYNEISEITWLSKDNCKKIVSRTLQNINSNITLAILVLLNNNIF